MAKKIAVVGVGAVGVEIIKILKKRNFPCSQLRVFARSARQIEVEGETYQVESICDENFKDIDIALFAGTEGESGASLQYAEKFIKQGAVVIDNGKDFRMEKEVPLVVPEVNRKMIFKNRGIIANPNCTTIQMVVALGGIFKRFGLKKIIMTSLQATSGGGRQSAQSLWQETKHIIEKNQNKDSFDQLDKNRGSLESAFACQIAFNVIAQIGSFDAQGFSSEETKVDVETRKIYDNDKIKISATCIRVPVFTSHSESIYFETEKPASLSQVNEALKGSEGVVFQEDPAEFPLPLDIEGTDFVYAGRLRRDLSQENCFWLWAVADNLRKGAALNAVQIAENLL